METKIEFIGPPELFSDGSEGFKSSSIEDFMEYVSDDKNTVFGIDTETEGFFDFQNKIIMLQIGTGERQFVFDLRETFDFGVYESLLSFFSNPMKKKLFWNVKFDYQFLRLFFESKGLKFEMNNFHDLFLTECIITTGIEGRDLSLAGAALRYCSKVLNKAERNKFVGSGSTPFTYNQIKYGAEDVQFLGDIYAIQQVEVENWGLQLVDELENKTVKVLCDIEWNGMRIDEKLWASTSKIIKEQCTESKNMLDSILFDYVSTELVPDKAKALRHIVPDVVQIDLFGKQTRKVNINWSSSPQVRDVLKSMGIPHETASSKELVKYSRVHRLIPELLKFKKLNKLMDSFGISFLKMINPVTGRVHQNIWQILDTGRMSSKEPNLTQIPSKGDLGKLIRSAFIAASGWKIVGGDYSGCELRIICEGSGEEKWLEEFKGAGKVHDKVACMMFGIEMHQTNETPAFLQGASYRDVAKTIDFGLAYGMSEFKLANTMQIEVKEAKELIDKFFKAFPSIKGFLDRLGRFATTNGYIKTFKPYRRVRWFKLPEKGSYGEFKKLGEIERAGKNTPIQGANADITKQALCDLDDIISKNNYPVKIIHVVHDEILTECPEEFAEEWSKIMSEGMVNASKLVLVKTPMAVDCKITDCWKK